MTTTHEPTTVTPGRMWRDQAVCRNTDPEAFFPVAETGPQWEAQVAAAKAVCFRCPVRAECLAWALTHLPYGIAGGMTADERRRQQTGRRSRREPRARARPCGATSAETAAAGRDAIRRGCSPRVVARAFDVSERTAQRWAAQTRDRRDQQQTAEGTRT